MKTITIAGNVGKDAEVRRTQDGSAITGWTVAVEDRSGKEKSTIWFDCSLFGKRGESLAQYIVKGGKIVVTGDLGMREYNGKTYLTVKADNVTLMGGKPTDSGQGGGYPGPHDRVDMPSGLDDGDTIPFLMEWRV